MSEINSLFDEINDKSVMFIITSAKSKDEFKAVEKAFIRGLDRNL